MEAFVLKGKILPTKDKCVYSKISTTERIYDKIILLDIVARLWKCIGRKCKSLKPASVSLAKKCEFIIVRVIINDFFNFLRANKSSPFN